MSENRTSTGLGSASTSGEATGSTTDTGVGRSSMTPASTAAGTAVGLAQEYGHKISEAATQAREYVGDKVAVVSDKIKELQKADLGELTENAKDYARKNPGQAILISAAAGLVLGLILRGSRR